MKKTSSKRAQGEEEQRTNSTGNKTKRIQERRRPSENDQEFHEATDDHQKTNERASSSSSPALLSPQATQREIEELERKAQVLRELLKTLETVSEVKDGIKVFSSKSIQKRLSDTAANSDIKIPTKKSKTLDEKSTDVEMETRFIRVTKEITSLPQVGIQANPCNDMSLPKALEKGEILIYSTRVREEDEDSLDRELMGSEPNLPVEVIEKVEVVGMDDVDTQ
jgi:hypothetical protein